jgi:hypothetical protein
MKIAGHARKSLQSIGISFPLIGVGIATEEARKAGQKPDEYCYECVGHSHLVLVTDANGKCPERKKGGADQLNQDVKFEPDYGYEIQFTKLFEDSLSRIFQVPIVGLLGAFFFFCFVFFHFTLFSLIVCYTTVSLLTTPLTVGGGPGSLQNVLEAIAGDFPMFVVKGTGRVADLICAFRENDSQFEEAREKQCAKLSEFFASRHECLL